MCYLKTITYECRERKCHHVFYTKHQVKVPCDIVNNDRDEEGNRLLKFGECPYKVQEAEDSVTTKITCVDCMLNIREREPEVRRLKKWLRQQKRERDQKRRAWKSLEALIKDIENAPKAYKENLRKKKIEEEELSKQLVEIEADCEYQEQWLTDFQQAVSAQGGQGFLN